MLYKKYHRNYVKQFKKGTEFILKGYADDCIRKVTVEPYIELWHGEEFYITVGVTILRDAIDSVPWINSITSLIDFTGRLMKKDAIQKIS